MDNKVVVFDFDGTIADSFGDFVRIQDKISKQFGFISIKDYGIEKIREKTSRQVLRELKTPIFKLPLLLFLAKKEYNKTIHKAKTFPQMKETLIEMQKNEIHLGLVTSNSLENVHSFLKNNDLEYFDFIHTSSGLFGKRRKLKHVIQQRGYKVDNVFYVGDETRDIEASRIVGCKMISVAWGYNTWAALERFGTDYLINHPQEILQIVIDNK